MDTMIPILNFHGQDGIQAVRAKALYSALYADAGHYSRWAETAITSNPAAIRGQDWVFATVAETSPLGGRPSIEIDLTLAFAEHLAMMANSQKGREVRDYFRRCRDELKKLAPDWSSMLPKSFPEALRALADKTEALEQEKALRAQEAPFVAFAEKIGGSPSLLTVDETAKELGLPVVAFRKFVQGNYLFRRHGEWWPYEEYGESGRKWFQMTGGTWESKGGSNIAFHTCKVTGLGQIKLKDAWERATAPVAADAAKAQAQAPAT